MVAPISCYDKPTLGQGNHSKSDTLIINYSFLGGYTSSCFSFLSE